jgi:hypothetical protein
MYITLLFIIAVLLPRGTFAEPSAAKYEHAFRSECMSAQKSLQLATLLANNTAELAESFSAKLYFMGIQDRLQDLDEKINSMRICTDGFYIRFWEGARKFSGERATISRMGDEVSKMEERINVFPLQWQLEKERLATVEEDLRMT